jgi:serine/threonine-protein kinase
MQKFLKEVGRRNVFRVAFVYIIAAWLTMQVVDVMFPALNIPDWLTSAIAVMLLIGLPFALIFAWAFEMTPEGIKREKDVDRNQSITPQTGKKLNHTIVVILVFAVTFLLVDKFVLAPDNSNQPPDAVLADIKPSIAVLPFVNMSGDQENEYFSDGLSEELLNLLAKIPRLHVAGRTSSFQFKGMNEDLRLIGEKLNVANVLEGSVRKSGPRIRITAQLIDAESGYHLWSDTYDRELTDVFAIQDEIAANVVAALRVTLLGEGAPSASHSTQDIDAYNLYLQARYFMDQTSEENLAKAEQSLRQAIDLDPNYAQAYASLALAHQERISGFVSDGTEDFIAGFRQVHEYADRALELGPNLPESHIAKGVAKSSGDWDFDGGLQHFARALELVPNHLDALSWSGTPHLFSLRHNKSVPLFEKVLQLDPLSITAHRDLGNAYQAAGRIDEAIATYEQALRLQPDTARVHGYLARIYLDAGKFESAAGHASQEPVGWVRDMLAIMLNSKGQDSDAYQAAVKAYEDKYGASNSYQLAEMYGYVGDLDNTFKWLKKSHEVRDPGPEMLKLAGF